MNRNYSGIKQKTSFVPRVMSALLLFLMPRLSQSPGRKEKDKFRSFHILDSFIQFSISILQNTMRTLNSALVLESACMGGGEKNANF